MASIGIYITTTKPFLYDNSLFVITYIIGIITTLVLFLFVNIMPKRTPIENKMLGRIRGFKRFLETAEKEKLEELVKENPEYFYNILPYTYALGVSSVWMKQFETIAVKAPDWYSSNESFSIYEFNHFMSDTMKSATTSMSSTPSSSGGSSSDGISSSSSSSSGGGFSGGGSGGGGGGSW